MPRSPYEDLNFALLQSLLALIETRSVSLAARRLGISQPAASRALQKLRVHFGDPLLLRTPGGMTPTPRAERLLAPLRRWLADGASLLNPVDEAPERMRRVFRIASTDYGVASVIAPSLSIINSVAPGVGMEVVPLSEDSPAKLRDGELDLAITGFEPDDSLLHSRMLFRDRWICVLRKGHPLLSMDLVTPEAFLAWPQIIFTILDRAYPELSPDLPAESERRVLLRTPNSSVMPWLVGQSDSIAFLPSRAVSAYASGLGLCVFDPPFALKDFGYWIAWHERSRRDPAISWLCAQISAVFQTDCELRAEAPGGLPQFHAQSHSRSGAGEETPRSG